MNTGEKIKARRVELGLTLEDVAIKCGVGKSTVRKWETGFIANMRRDRIALLAQALDVDVNYILDDNETEISPKSRTIPPYSNISQIHKKRVPMLGKIACGEPIYADEDRESYVMSGTDVQADFCLTAQGDSMIGARIMDGDIVFIREQPMVDDGQIAAVIIDDEATLKRVYYDRENNTLMLVAENPKYKPFVYRGDELEQVHILGLAVAFQSDVR